MRTGFAHVHNLKVGNGGELLPRVLAAWQLPAWHLWFAGVLAS
jgi:hypothetical protein